MSVLYDTSGRPVRPLGKASVPHFWQNRGDPQESEGGLDKEGRDGNTFNSWDRSQPGNAHRLYRVDSV